MADTVRDRMLAVPAFFWLTLRCLVAFVFKGHWTIPAGILLVVAILELLAKVFLGHFSAYIVGVVIFGLWLFSVGIILLGIALDQVDFDQHYV